VSQRYPDYTVYLVIPVRNEGDRIHSLVSRIPFDRVDRAVIIDDFSTDGALDNLSHPSTTVIRNDSHQNIGATIRNGLNYSLTQSADILAIMAGNSKDDPAELPRLIDPIVNEDYEFVQGSRYLAGGRYNRMPFHRSLGTRLYPLLIRLTTGFNASDTTNGFRAFKASILKDHRININQDWLQVCLEYYIYIRVVQLGFKMKEVPVSKVYPEHVPYSLYTKVRPVVDWIHVLKPFFYLLVLKTRS